MLLRRLLFITLLFIPHACAARSEARAPVERRVRVAVLDFGASETGRRAADRVSATLATMREATTESGIVVIDREQARAAARGNGYDGSLNMTLDEARTLGAAIGCDFFITGDAQTLRRSPSDRAAHYESFAAVFIVSARTGRLVKWERRAATATAASQEAETLLLAELTSRVRSAYAATILEAHTKEADERRARAAAATAQAAGQTDASEEFEDLSGAEATEGDDLRLPHPYRRLRPPYPPEAARDEIEATVEAIVDIDREGEVRRVEISRWAGFGLDEAVVSTVRQLHFRPALRDGTPRPVRVLLRYNFRRPPTMKK